MNPAFRHLADHSSDVVLRYPLGGSLVFASKASTSVLGFAPAALVGRPPLELVHPDERERFLELVRRAVAGEEAIGQIRLKRADDTYCWTDAALFAVSNEIIASCRDVAHVTAFEQTMVSSDGRLQKIAENVPGMLYQALTFEDQKAVYLYVSEWVERVIGIPRAAIYAGVQALHDRIHPDDIESYREAARRARANDSVFHWTGRVVDREGRELHLFTHAMPERRPDGRVLWSGAMLDVTEARLAQNALAQVHERFREVVDGLEVAFVRSLPDGTIVVVNTAATKLLGYDRVADLRGRKTTAIWADPADRARMLASVPVGEGATFTAAGRRKDGTGLTLETRVRAVRSSDGSVVGYEDILRDVTESHRAHESLERAKATAELAAQAKSSFLANISHEIRTPMNAIVGLTRLALDTNQPAKVREYLTHVESASRTLLALLNDVLDVSKIEAGKLQLEHRAFELDAVVESMVAVSRERAAAKGLELCIAVDPNVPPTLVGDSLRLGQVLSNLVSNAIKFTEHGEILVSVDLELAESDRVRLRFSVRDRGIGIEREALSRLFQPFAQADSSTTRRYGGTGLGLALCRQIVEHMGGRLEVESEPGQGSTFSFAVDLGLALAAEQTRQPSRAALDLRGLRALVVDDNAVSRSVLAGNLSAMAFLVSTATSGREAIEMLRLADAAGEPYRLVLMDGVMPQMSGIETAERLATDAAVASKPSIIMVSAYEPQEPTPGSPLRIAARLRKPVSRSTLLDCILGVLNLKAPEKEEDSWKPHMPMGRPLEGARVLAVEDHDVNQLILGEILTHLGARTTFASGGEAALEIVADDANTFDIVLMDVQMPGMDGLETTRRLRQMPRVAHLPIVALTAHAFEEERQRCLAAGMNDHLAKPIDPAMLLAVMQRWLRFGTSVESRRGRQTRPETAEVDERALTQIFGEDQGRKREFVNRLVESCRKSLAAAEPAFTGRDAAALSALGHKLKSPPKNIGANALGAALEGIESAAKEGNFDAAIAFRARAWVCLDALDAWIRRTGPVE